MLSLLGFVIFASLLRSLLMSFWWLSALLSLLLLLRPLRLLTFNLLRNLLAFPVNLVRFFFPPKPGRLLTVTIEKEIPRWRFLGFVQRLRGESLDLTLDQWREIAEGIKTSPRVKGLVCHIQELHASWAQIEEMREIFLMLQQAGKPVALAPETLDLPMLYLATASDKLILAPSANVAVVSPVLTTFFAKDFLQKIGVKAEFIQLGKHKNAPETFSRAYPSPTNRTDIDELLEDYRLLCFDTLAKRFNKTTEEIAAILDRGIFSPQEALQAGLIDAIRFPRNETYFFVEGKTREPYGAPEDAVLFLKKETERRLAEIAQASEKESPFAKEGDEEHRSKELVSSLEIAKKEGDGAEDKAAKKEGDGAEDKAAKKEGDGAEKANERAVAEEGGEAAVPAEVLESLASDGRAVELAGAFADALLQSNEGEAQKEGEAITTPLESSAVEGEGKERSGEEEKKADVSREAEAAALPAEKELEESELEPPPTMELHTFWRRRPIWWRWKRIRSAPSVAILPVVGTIQEDGTPNPAMGEEVASSRRIMEILEDIYDDASVQGVVAFVNSRGGAATASEAIWYGLRVVGQEKPVVAYLDNYAASGGYYVACGAERIISNPWCLTGSIGVFGGKFLVRDLLAKLSLHIAQMGATEGTRLLSGLHEAGEEDTLRRKQQMEEVYEQFLSRVAVNREKTRDEIHALAQGKVYFGYRALEKGLVDACGTLHDAIRWVREESDSPKAKPHYITMGGALSLRELLMTRMKAHPMNSNDILTKEQLALLSAFGASLPTPILRQAWGELQQIMRLSQQHSALLWSPLPWKHER
jgi:signal peptide peptidase SppA